MTDQVRTPLTQEAECAVYARRVGFDAMRFMLMVKQRARTAIQLRETAASLPELVRFHEAMRRAGILRAVEGLHTSDEAVRVQYAGHQRVVVDGPAADADLVMAGFWLIQVNSREEAVAWARQAPLVDGEIEVRQAAFQLLQVRG